MAEPALELATEAEVFDRQVIRKMITKNKTLQNQAWSDGFWHFMAFFLLLAVLSVASYLIFIKVEGIVTRAWQWSLEAHATQFGGKTSQAQPVRDNVHVALHTNTVHVTPKDAPSAGIDMPIVIGDIQPPKPQPEPADAKPAQQLLDHYDIVHVELAQNQPVIAKPVEPEPVKPVEPEPVKPVEPEPVKPVEPEPVKPVEPEPVKPVEPEPVKPVEPEPVKPVEPEPVKPVEPEPVKPRMTRMRISEWDKLFN